MLRIHILAAYKLWCRYQQSLACHAPAPLVSYLAKASRVNEPWNALTLAMALNRKIKEDILMAVICV